MSGTALKAVADDRSGVLGSDRSLGQLPCSLQGLPSSTFSHPSIVSDVPGRLSSDSGLAARGQGDACQRNLGNCPRSGSWLSTAPGLHQGLRCRVSVGTLTRDQTSPLSGRLVGSCLLGAGSQIGSPVAAFDLSHPQDCDKRKEVGSCVLTD